MIEDEIREMVPTATDQEIEVITTEFCSSVQFAVDLDTIARIIMNGKIPKKEPRIFVPWKPIYTEAVRQTTIGKPIELSFSDSCASVYNLRIGRVLQSLIEGRIVAIKSRKKDRHKYTSDDYRTQLSASGFDIRRNLAGNKVEIDGKAIDQYLESRVRIFLVDAGYDNKTMIEDVINVIADEHSYHPIKDYLHGLSWDGTPRIEQMANDCFDYETPFFPALLKKWMIGSVDRVMNGGQNPMLIMDGPQGCGKSTFVRWLCPLEKFFREGPIQPDDKDDKIGAAESWIWEVAELGATTRRADREALKSFLTTKIFTGRAPYGKHSLQYECIASFIGTVNNDCGLLDDPTGARRFRPVRIKSISLDYRMTNVHDLWAEAYDCWKRGETCELSPDMEASMESVRAEYKMVNPTEECIRKHFQIIPGKDDWRMKYDDIRLILKDPERGNLTGSDLSPQSIGKALKSLGVENRVVWTNGKSCRVYIGIAPALIPIP